MKVIEGGFGKKNEAGVEAGPPFDMWEAATRMIAAAKEHQPDCKNMILITDTGGAIGVYGAGEVEMVVPYALGLLAIANQYVLNA